MADLFKLHDINGVPEASRATLEIVQKNFGFIPNLMRIFAKSPVALQSYLAVSSIFENSDFTPAERQIILLAISIENQCEYCVAVHSTIAKNSVKVDGGLLEQLRNARALSDPKLEALARFTRLVVQKRGFVGDGALKTFFEVGYSERHVLEVIVAIGLKTISNYTNHFAHTPLDPQFQPETWKPSK